MIEPAPAPRRAKRWALVAALLALAAAAAWWWRTQQPPAQPAAAVPATNAPSGTRAALSVALTSPRREDWPRTIAAQGNIAAWQEAAVGAELAGFRVTSVLVSVGDRVRKGQTLATLNTEAVAAELAQVRASVAEAEAVLAEAKANAARSRDLAQKGFLSAQALTQSATLEQTAAARVAAARARLQAEELRMTQTRVVAPDDGTISARAATIGALAQPGQEMFRLIRGNRLEWRAEVTAAELGQLTPGVPARVRLPNGSEAKGVVRAVAPTVDAQTRNAIVYVDLPPADATPARPGMFARGEFELGRGSALALPQSAVALRDGFAYVFRVGADGRAVQTKVVVGRRSGDRVEILEGLAADARVVASGTGFLSDGDLVRVVDAAATASR
jgi:RND family efflux transporter MFP subunit